MGTECVTTCDLRPFLQVVYSSCPVLETNLVSDAVSLRAMVWIIFIKPTKNVLVLNLPTPTSSSQ